ncbi:IS66 family insertion sequence element accessory protein TnpB [Gracilibacillus alcaliphilus]|uniref:IS66 family insertion sequence element accessory protein TnpB n=1 Tax=Gracilibacillus alcaliphilus TaxID=1401441 RepID=UPI0019589BD2|nr:IS66 family insertion sequence element accessory protein TnpB [Gracilibacillus alcaliphilus]MBM7679422.1 transposase [Gracilibacillus alcaliphilus]
MLVDFSKVQNCYLVCGYTDLRKGIDGLATVITSQFQLNLLDESVFLFCGRRTDRFKALWFDGEGFYLLYKRYDQGKLTWPRSQTDVEKLTAKQIEWLFDGFSIYQKQKIQPAQLGVLT